MGSTTKSISQKSCAATTAARADGNCDTANTVKINKSAHRKDCIAHEHFIQEFLVMKWNFEEKTLIIYVSNI